MDQESLEKILTEVDNSQPKLRRLNRMKGIMEVKLKEQDLITHSTWHDVLYEEHFEIQDVMHNPIAFKATNDPDTMCYHEDMREFDRG